MNGETMKRRTMSVMMMEKKEGEGNFSMLSQGFCIHDYTRLSQCSIGESLGSAVVLVENAVSELCSPFLNTEYYP